MILSDQEFAQFTIKTQIELADIINIKNIARDVEVFTEIEVETAAELAEDCLKDPSAYYFILLYEPSGELAGYSCYNKIPLTDQRFDLYWIVVAKKWQNKGLGRKILNLTGEQIIKMKGRLLYAETSGLPHYFPTRQFYEKSNFTQVANIADFYKDGDAKVIYCKKLS